ncbi:Hypothetical protein, putative [Bodo saltans]|uniref:Uncharacterized protein n=1 Tax=Bodo saltans TaxID=75058 RepID=A0A0S4KK29_BODSA|nr:Hypothetical protein, putative [Bodo saltans]|eukprot:CUI14760.1 Hypothetical protein, putative [Bodo saltans]
MMWGRGISSTAQQALCFFPNRTTSGVLYIADLGNNAIRRLILDTNIVSTVTSSLVPICAFLVVNLEGSLIFVSSADNTNVVSQVNVSTGAVVTVAGNSGAVSGGGFQEGVGTNAEFYDPRGVALSSDETVLYVGDYKNFRLRRINLSTTAVTTAAGSGAPGTEDGPLLNATFTGFGGIKWHCNTTARACGVLAVAYTNAVSDMFGIRFIPLEPLPVVTQSMPTSPSVSPSTSATISMSQLSKSSTLSATHKGRRLLSVSGTFSSSNTEIASLQRSHTLSLSFSNSPSGTKRSRSPSATMMLTVSGHPASVSLGRTTTDSHTLRTTAVDSRTRRSTTTMSALLCSTSTTLSSSSTKVHWSHTSSLLSPTTSVTVTDENCEPENLKSVRSSLGIPSDGFPKPSRSNDTTTTAVLLGVAGVVPQLRCLR